MPLIGQTKSDDAVFMSAAILLLVVLIGVFRLAYSCRLVLQVKSILNYLSRAISMCTKVVPSEVELVVREKLREQKLDQFRRFCQILCFMCTPFTVNLMINIWKGQSRGHTVTQDVVQLVEHFASALIIVFPGILSWRTIDIFYTGGVLCMAVYVAPFVSSPEFLFQSLLSTNFVVCTMTMVRRTDTPMVPLLNVAVIAVASTSIWMHGDRVFMQPKLMLGGQVMVGVVATALAHVFEKSSQAAIHQCLEMQTTKELLSAACGLLRSCYDVVVELDPEGVIVCPALDLGGFLLQGHGRGLQGRRLGDLMSDEADKQDFTCRLGAPKPEGMGLAEAMHVSMKDGTGNTLHLELLWFQFSCLSGELRYMLGIREFCDLSVRRRHQNQDTTIDPNGMDQAAVSDRKEEFAVPEAFSVNTNLLADQQAVAILDCSKEGFLIKSVSSGFCMRVGRLPPTSRLLHFVKQGENLRAWMQDALYAWAMHDEPPEDFKITLRMPQGDIKATSSILRDDIATSASHANMEEAEHQGAVENIDMQNVRLLLFNIRAAHSRRARSPVQEQHDLKGTPVALVCL